MVTPPYADRSRVHIVIGGSAPVRSADRACFHMENLGRRGTVRLLQNTNFLMCLSRLLEWYPYYVSGSKLVLSHGYQIRNAQAFKFSKSL